MFSVSQYYLSQICKDQTDFNKSLEFLSTRETPSALYSLISTPINQLNFILAYKPLMNIWLEVFVEAKKIDCDVKPLFALRFIQFIEYGFSHGWRSPKQLSQIKKIYRNFEFANLTKLGFSFKCEGYRGFCRFYNLMEFEFVYEFPYDYLSFKDNLQIHYDEFSKNLKKYPIDILRLPAYVPLRSIKLLMEREQKLQGQIFPQITHENLQPIFEKYLLRSNMSLPIPVYFLKGLSKRINFFISNSHGPRGGDVPFKLPLYKISKASSTNLASQENYIYDCIAHIYKCQTKIDLYLTHLGLQLDSGNENQVYRSQKFSLSVSPEGSLDIRYFRMVRFIPQLGIHSNLVDSTLRINSLRRIIQQKPTKINLIPRSFFGIKAPYTNFQMYEEWQNSTFCGVFDKMEIPEDFYPGARMRQVSIREYFPLLIKTAKILADIHRIGLVHLDIKPKNLLVRLQEDGQLQIIPTDFTRCCSFTIGPAQEDSEYYYYWDVLRKDKGTKLPYTDWYGLIMTTADVLIPKFNELAIEGISALPRMEKHKSHAYDYFIRSYAKYLGKLELPAEKTMHALCKSLENYLKNNSLLTKTERECFYEIIYKAKAIQLTFDLLIETLKIEKKIVKDFPEHELLANAILLNGSLIDKINFLNNISMGPALIEELIIRLQAMHETLESYYKYLSDPNSAD